MNNSLKVVILAAGDSKRFGPDSRPKQFLEFAAGPGRPVLQMWENVLDGLTIPSDVYLVTRADYANLVGVGPPRHGMRRSVVQLQTKTRGQADTLRRVLNDYMYWDGDILVVNCDQGFGFDVLDKLVAKGMRRRKVAALTFRAGPEEATRWSYVDDHPYFHEAAEKTAISTHALAGAYYFPSIEELRVAVDRAVLFKGFEGEPYISHAFQFIPDEKYSVEILRSEWYDWGTPQALERFLNREHHPRS